MSKKKNAPEFVKVRNAVGTVHRLTREQTVEVLQRHPTWTVIGQPASDFLPDGPPGVDELSRDELLAEAESLGCKVWPEMTDDELRHVVAKART